MSMLVRTGVYAGGSDANDTMHPADFVVEDVNEAVTAALRVCKRL